MLILVEIADRFLANYKRLAANSSLPFIKPGRTVAGYTISKVGKSPQTFIKNTDLLTE